MLLVEADAAAPAVVLDAGAFRVVPATTPFLIVPITVLLLVAGGGAGSLGTAPGGAVAGRFLTTVEVLASLDSLLPLARRAVRVAGLDGGWATAAVTVAPRFLLAAAVPAPPSAELAVVEVVVLRGAGAARVARAFSTMLLRMVVAIAALPGVTAGRAILGLPGVATVRSRGATRELDVVGERI